MDSRQARISIILVLVLCSGLIFIFPIEPVLNTEVLFDDKVTQRIENERVDDSNTEEILLIITHDDKGPLTNNLSRVQKLLSLEEKIISNENNIGLLSNGTEYIGEIKSPIKTWLDAFNSRNRSLINATKWADVLQPIVKNGWCGENAVVC